MKIKSSIEGLVDALDADGKDCKKISRRLIEHGFQMMMAEGDLSAGRPVVPEEDGSFFVSKVTIGADKLVTASSSPLESILDGLPSIEALPVLKCFVADVYEAEQEGKPLISRDVPVDQRIVGVVLTALGYLKVDELSDVISLTTEGRLLIGLKPEGVLDLSVEVAEITGNVEESELAARYMDGKVAAIDKALSTHAMPIHQAEMPWKEAYEHIAITLRETAREFRLGLHIPSVHIDGRVIPYNEDRSTGVSHAQPLGTFFSDVYHRNVQAGWWNEITTGERKKRSVGELFMLMVTEIAEAYLAYVERAADDKLPEYPGLGVEMADLGIRWADFCGALYDGVIVEDSGAWNPGAKMFRQIVEIANEYELIRKTPEAKGDPELGEPIPPMDVALMVDVKLAFNATRADHKIENRLKEGGKKT